jgi:hypothetical protein
MVLREDRRQKLADASKDLKSRIIKVEYLIHVLD